MDYSKGKNFDTFIKMSANIKDDYTKYLIFSLLKDQGSFKDFSSLKDLSETQGVKSENFQKKFQEFYTKFSKSTQENMSSDDKEVFSDILFSPEKKVTKVVSNKRTQREVGKCDSQIESRYEEGDMIHYHYCSKASVPKNAIGEYLFCTLHMNKYKDDKNNSFIKNPIPKEKTVKKGGKSQAPVIENDDTQPSFKKETHKKLDVDVIEVKLGKNLRQFIVDTIDESETKIIALISTNNQIETVLPVSESLKEEFLSNFKIGFSFLSQTQSQDYVKKFNEKLEVRPSKIPSTSSPKKNKTNKSHKEQESESDEEEKSDEGNSDVNEKIEIVTKKFNNEFMGDRNTKSFEEKNGSSSVRSSSISRTNPKRTTVSRFNTQI